MNDRSKLIRILYFHTGRSSFVDKDVNILQEISEVSVFAFSADKKWKTPLLFLRQLIFILRHLFTADLFVVQFAGYHSFLPCLLGKLTGKKSLIIAGGTDCVSYPTIRYGNFYKSILGRFTRWSYSLCDHISPKHDSLMGCEYYYDRSVPLRQGILAFMPKLDKPYTNIPNGYDIEFWKCENTERPKRTFITVTSGLEYPFQIKLKGIDLILEAAPDFPDYVFTIVGVPNNIKLPIKSSNVRTLPPTNADGLRELYCTHTYYIQISMAEGFPNALSEAMLCGCVPIGSTVFAIPEIISNNGILLNKRDINAFKAILRQTETLDTGRIGAQAAQSMRERFPISRRKKQLVELVRSLTDTQ